MTKYRVMLYIGKTQEQKLSLDKTAEDEKAKFPGVEVYSGDGYGKYGDVRKMLVIIPFESGSGVETSDPWHGTEGILVEDFICDFEPGLSNLPDGVAERSMVISVKVNRATAVIP